MSLSSFIMFARLPSQQFSFLDCTFIFQSDMPAKAMPPADQLKASPVKSQRPENANVVEAILAAVNVTEIVKNNKILPNQAAAAELVKVIMKRCPANYAPTLKAVQSALSGVDTHLLRAVSKCMDKKDGNFEHFRQEAIWLHEAWKKVSRNNRLKDARGSKSKLDLQTEAVTKEEAEEVKVKLEAGEQPQRKRIKKAGMKTEPAEPVKRGMEEMEAPGLIKPKDEALLDDKPGWVARLFAGAAAHDDDDGDADEEEGEEEEEREHDEEVEAPKLDKKENKEATKRDDEQKQQNKVEDEMEDMEEEEEEEEEHAKDAEVDIQAAVSSAGSAKTAVAGNELEVEYEEYEEEEEEDVIEHDEEVEPAAGDKFLGCASQVKAAHEPELELPKAKMSGTDPEYKFVFGKPVDPEAQMKSSHGIAAEVASDDESGSAGKKKPKGKATKTAKPAKPAQKRAAANIMEKPAKKAKGPAKADPPKPLAKAPAPAADAKAKVKQVSAFNIYMAYKLKNSEFMPGASRKERFAAAAKGWINPDKGTNKTTGCSKCYYSKNGCRKCNPARFEGR